MFTMLPQIASSASSTEIKRQRCSFQELRGRGGGGGGGGGEKTVFTLSARSSREVMITCALYHCKSQAIWRPI